MKTITITLTEDEAKEVTSVLNCLTARLQYRASHTTTRRKYSSWSFWHTLVTKFNVALGMTYMDTSSAQQQDLLDN